MATTQITVAAFQLALAECGDAIAAADWATASTKYAVAEAINSGLALESWAGEFKIQRRESLAGLQRAIDAAKTAAASSSSTRRVRTGLRFG